MKKHKQLKKHHAKPVRKRHLGLSVAGLCLVVIASYGLGFGSSQVLESGNTEQVIQNVPGSRTVVDSSYGFSLPIDLNTYDISGTELVNGEAVALGAQELERADEIVAVTARPLAGRIEPAQSGSSFTVRTSTDIPAYQAALAAEEQDALKAAARLFRPEANVGQNRILLSSSNEEISGLSMQKDVYELVTNLGGELNQVRTYEVIYSGLLRQNPISVRISGLVGGSTLPNKFSDMLGSIRFDFGISSNDGIEPIDFSIPGFGQASAVGIEGLNGKFLADLTSPSVVKIYNGVCGKIQFNQTVGQEEICSGGTGSGFFITSKGHIATNGHVVVLEAEDLLAEVFLSDPSVFVEYLSSSGLSILEINQVLTDPEKASAAIASIYDQPSDTFTLVEEKRRILVAVSDDAVDALNPELFFATKETGFVKEAVIIDSDYSARDVYALGISGGEFSASDVAIIKIDINNAPALPLAAEEPIQNEPLIVLGFPGDAENALVDNNELAISVTNGSVSSTRSAVGGGKLYQSDADASSGNSGGPAINDASAVIGLVTYRFNDGEATNASKTYIRDINDIMDLAEENNIELNQESATYDAWLSGLRAYSQNKFNAAQDSFGLVESEYPEHRLVDSYQSRAQEAVKEGRSVDDFPVLILSVIGLVGTLLLIVGIVLTARHNKHHRRHLIYQASSTTTGLTSLTNHNYHHQT